MAKSPHQKKSPAGPYVMGTLQPGEDLYWVGRIHWGFFVAPLLFFIVAGYGTHAAIDWAWHGRELLLIAWLPALAAAPLIRTIVIYVSTEAAVTSSRVIYKTGLVSRYAEEILISKVETVGIEQSIVGRLIGYGTVRAQGTGGHRMDIPGIAAPMDFRQVMQTIIHSR